MDDPYCFQFATILKENSCLDRASMHFTGMDSVIEFIPDDVRDATVKFDLETMARETVRLFLDLCERPSGMPRRVLVGCSVVENL